MPNNLKEGIFFSVMMTFIMVYAMICYNIALATGGMNTQIFLMAFGEMKIMWPVALVLEMIVLGKPIMMMTERCVTKDSPLMSFIIFRSSITVALMCPCMSLIATILFKDASANFVGTWLQTTALNFPMAFFWQLFYAGPLGRLIFRLCFRRKSQVAKMEKEIA